MSTTINGSGDVLTLSAASMAAAVYQPSGTGAVATTVATKLAESVSVKDFNAKGDGVTDDTAAIQAAINFFKPVSGSDPQTGGIVLFPPGNYKVSSTVQAWSGVQLVGVGAASIITGVAPISGQIIQLASLDGSGQYRYGQVRDLAFVCATTGVWAIKSSATNVLNSIIENIKLNVNLGISVCETSPTYTQDTIIRNVWSTGSIDQILALSGNFNHVENIDKEGSTGTTTDSYIKLYAAVVGNANDNSFKKILLEGTCSANKTPIQLVNCSNTTFDDVWFEGGFSNGYMFDISNSSNTKFIGNVNTSGSTIGKIKVSTNSTVCFDYFNCSGDDISIGSYFTIDSTSRVKILRLYSRRNADLFLLSGLPNLIVEESVDTNLIATPVSGINAIARPDFTSGQNMLINPSFEAGVYGWSYSGGAPTTETYTTSDVGQGLMWSGIWSGGGTKGLYQTITVAANQVGMPFTLRALVKITGGGWVSPWVANVTMSGDYRANSGTGWQVVTTTVYPTSSGAFIFGIQFISLTGASQVWADDLSVTIGTQVLVNSGKFGSFELNQKTFTTGTAAPATGTWKVGDHVFNSAPAVGSPKGWICTVAGTPGTWVSEGNL